MSLDEEQSIWGHLEELAQRLRRVLFVVVIATVAIAGLPSDIGSALRLDFSDYRPLVSKAMGVVQEFLLPEGVTLIAFNWLDTFYTYFLVAIALGVLVSLPYIAYELFKFVSPALYPHERRYIHTFIAVFTVLFFVGATYAWFILLPTTFAVLYRFVYQTGVMPLFSVKDFFNMVAFGLVGSGLFYTFPVVVWILVKADLFEVQTLKDNRKQILVGLLIFTAVFTPDPTPFSMVLMSVPFYLIYEMTIRVLGMAEKRKAADDVLELGLKASRELLARTQEHDS